VLARRLQRGGGHLDGTQALAQSHDSAVLALDRISEPLVLYQQWLTLRNRVPDHVTLGDAAERSQRLPFGVDRGVRVEGEVGGERVGDEAALLAGHDGGPLLQRA